MHTLKVTGEKYRVYPTGDRIVRATIDADGKYLGCHAAPYLDFSDIRSAAMEAFQIAGRLACKVMIDCVTFHEPVPAAAFDPADELAWLSSPFNEGVTETVTGTYEVGFPHFTEPSLSRYHPNNGWVIPETITVK